MRLKLKKNKTIKHYMSNIFKEENDYGDERRDNRKKHVPKHRKMAPVKGDKYRKNKYDY